MSPRRPWRVPLCAFLLLGVACAHAGEYRLVYERTPHAPKPGSTELEWYDRLCESVVPALNRMEPVRPMSCGFEVAAESNKVNTPEWTPLDPRKHMDLLRKIVAARDSTQSAEEQQALWSEHKANIVSGETRLWRAEFDLNNQPGNEIVLRHDITNCDLPLGIAVVKESVDGLHLDHAYWRLHETPYYQPFLYGGRTWLWRWWGWNDDAEGAVYQTAWALAEFGWYRKSSCKIDYVE